MLYHRIIFILSVFCYYGLHLNLENPFCVPGSKMTGLLKIPCKSLMLY